MKFKTLEKTREDPAAWRGLLRSGEYFTIDYNSGQLIIKLYYEQDNEDSFISQTDYKVGRTNDTIIASDELMLAYLEQAQRAAKEQGKWT